MTKQEILNVLIPHYEKCIEELKGMDREEAMRYLFRKRIYRGVCKAIYDLFGIRYYSENMPDWIRRNIRNGSAFWAEPPDMMLNCLGLKACIDMLQIRVDIMKKELLIIECLKCQPGMPCPFCNGSGFVNSEGVTTFCGFVSGCEALALSGRAACTKPLLYAGTVN